jgi:hypothetical protein
MMDEGFGLIESVITLAIGIPLIFGGPALYLLLQIRALLRWRGWWRLAAVPPLLLMAGATALMVEGFRQGSNLAPLGVVLGAPVALVWLWIAGAIRGQALR